MGALPLSGQGFVTSPFQCKTVHVAPTRRDGAFQVAIDVSRFRYQAMSLDNDHLLILKINEKPW